MSAYIPKHAIVGETKAGAKPGSDVGHPKRGGRQKGDKNKKTVLLEAAMMEARDVLSDRFGPNDNSLAFLQAVYRHPRLHLTYRQRAAIAAAQYEMPKLQTIAHTGADGGPIKLEDVNLLETSRAIAFMLAKAISLKKQEAPKEGPVLEHSDCAPLNLSLVPAMLAASVAEEDGNAAVHQGKT